MNKMKFLERIVSDPEIMVGKPVVKSTRLTVQYILKLLANSETIEEIMEEYEGLTCEYIMACLLFASEILENTTFSPLDVSALT